MVLIVLLLTPLFRAQNVENNSKNNFYAVPDYFIETEKIPETDILVNFNFLEPSTTGAARKNWIRKLGFLF